MICGRMRLLAAIELGRDLEPLAPLTISAVCFRQAPENLRNNDQVLNEFNIRLIEALQSDGEALVSGTSLRDRFVLRACVLH